MTFPAALAAGLVAGVVISGLVAVCLRLYELHVDAVRMSAEIKALAMQQAAMAAALNQIAAGLNAVKAVLAQHDQFIAFMTDDDEDDEDTPPHGLH